jgi:surface protein
MFHDCVNLQGFNAKNWKMPELLTSSHMFRGCTSASSIDVSGWYTPKLTSMDGMFHTCKELTTIDVSSFDTSKCEEISQVFEHCYKLEEIKGMGNWNTESCRTFEECFSSCYALKVLDMSGFNTRMVEDAFHMQNNATGNGFANMLPNMRSLEKMILSADFSFDGDGKVTTEYKKVILPSPAAKEGFTAKWQNAATGVLYDASEIPEETAATYVAYYIPNP